MIKKLTVIALILVALPVALFGGYYLYISQEVKLKIDQISSSDLIEYTEFKIQSDSQVYSDDFSDYIKLSMAQIENLKEVSSLVSNKLIFNQDVVIKSKNASKCEYNCLYIKSEFDELTPILWKGLMGVEDYRFFEHEGIDYKSILRAILVDLKAMKIVQGGSTLTQQLVKNLFLTSEKKISRKLKELIYASYIEDKLSKDQIIMLYFNNVYWGSFQGLKIKGIQAASLAYFDKRASELSSFEAIILIGMLKGPYYYSPFKKINRLKSRIDVVYKRLNNLKVISKNDKWSDRNWSNWYKKLTIRNKKSSYRSFTKIKNDSTLNNYEQFVLHQSIQRAKKIMSNSFKNRDIGIKILVSSNDKTIKNFRYYSKTQRNLNEAIEKERHQVASILKPLIYDYFFINGKKPEDLVSTQKITLNIKSGNWTPKDSSVTNAEYITLDEALRKSKNIPIVRLSIEEGFTQLENYLGIYVTNLKTPLSEYPSQILGAVEMSIFEVAQMYDKFLAKSCIENDFRTRTVEILSNSKDSTLKRVASEKFKLLKIFAKTGTSNKAMDNWFIGYDSKELIIIWLGQETDRDKERLIASGATSAFRIYQDFIFHRGKRINELLCKQGN